MTTLTRTVRDGYAVCGEWPHAALPLRSFPLIIADPPYGRIVSAHWDRVVRSAEAFTEWMLDWTRRCEALLEPGGALYVWGGIGKPNFRPFYRYLSRVEDETGLTLKNHITWAKKRAYGVQDNYLFTREELAYLVKGGAPRTFHIPLLEKKRGYAGYNPKYPAKSEFLRRTNVWTDVTEILRGKMQPTEKPTRLYEILLETHTEPGEFVLDPFAGSGVTARAARALGRRFVLVEKDPEVFAKMTENLAVQANENSRATL